MGLGGFKIKALAISGQKPTAESDLLSGKVLGYNWDIEKDMLSLSFPINLSRKKRGIRSEPNLSKDDIVSLKSKTLTIELMQYFLFFLSKCSCRLCFRIF